MIKIIPIRHFDVKKVIKMIEYVTPGLSPGMIDDGAFITFPFNVFHGLLPLNWKFLQETYVAVENNEPLGLISLAPDGHKKTRWKINRLVLGVNAHDVGKQLIDYVVNKYGGAGVEIFLAVIDENYTEAISLFTNACSFRSSSKINIWECEGTSPGNKIKSLENLRKAADCDFQKLFRLDSEATLPQFRTSLARTPEDFRFGLKSKIINNIKGYTSHKYVLDNPSVNGLEALLAIFTADKASFWLDITLSLAYREYYEDLLNFGIDRVNEQNGNARIYVGVKNYHQAGKYMAEVLKSHKFKQCGDFQVLVKDYWRPAGLYRERKAPAIIFPDMTSPACNIVRFITES